MTLPAVFRYRYEPDHGLPYARLYLSFRDTAQAAAAEYLRLPHVGGISDGERGVYVYLAGRRVARMRSLGPICGHPITMFGPQGLAGARCSLSRGHAVEHGHNGAILPD